jgi:hypothetical protein
MAGAFRNANATVAAHAATTVVASDATVFPVCRGLYVGTTGNLTVRMASTQATQLFSNVPVGIFPIQVDMVLSTGTTAADIVALY